MPYAPAVTDQTAQFRYQGLMGAANAISGGILDAAKQFHENKQAGDAADAVIGGTLAKNPQLLQGLGEKDQKLLEKYKSGETGLSDKRYLAGLITSSAQQQQEAQQQVIRDSQVRQIQQQQAATQRLTELGQLQTGGSSGMPSYYQRLTGQPVMNGTGSGVLNPQAQRQLQTLSQDPLMSTAAKIQMATGTPISPEVMANLAGHLATAQNRPPVPMVKPFPMHGTDAKGNPTIETWDAMTNTKMGGGPAVRPYQSPEEQGEAAGKVEEAKITAQSAGKLLDEVSTQAEAARQRQMDVSNISRLYAEGAQSGFGQEHYNVFQSAFARFNPDQKKITNNQELEQSLAKMALHLGKEMMSGSGSVSNYEREAILTSSANIRRTPEANMRILAMAKAVDDRRIAIENKRIELESTDMRPTEIAKEIRKYRAGLVKDADENYAREDALKKASAKYK